jgi:ABC-type sugar transport system ATPase subunit
MGLFSNLAMSGILIRKVLPGYGLSGDAAMNNTVIRVQDFRKVYGKAVAVDGINFEVKRGEIFGLLGPNGAIKTSTLESLEGLRSPDGGILL